DRIKRGSKMAECRASSSDNAGSDDLPQLKIPIVSHDQVAASGDDTGESSIAGTSSKQGYCDVPTSPDVSVQTGANGVTLPSAQYDPYTTAADTYISHKEASSSPLSVYPVAYENHHDGGRAGAYTIPDASFPHMPSGYMPLMNLDTYSTDVNLDSQVIDSSQMPDGLLWDSSCYSESHNRAPSQHFDYSVNYSESETDLFTMAPSVHSSPELLLSPHDSLLGWEPYNDDYPRDIKDGEWLN
ncbi:unnamed protein product, partial [Fusarium langsethiae]